MADEVVDLVSSDSDSGGGSDDEAPVLAHLENGGSAVVVVQPRRPSKRKVSSGTDTHKRSRLGGGERGEGSDTEVLVIDGDESVEAADGVIDISTPIPASSPDSNRAGPSRGRSARRSSGSGSGGSSSVGAMGAGVVTSRDFVAPEGFHDQIKHVERRSEISNQDWEFEKARLADLAKAHKKRQAELEREENRKRRACASSWLESHRDDCFRLVERAKNTAEREALDSPSSSRSASPPETPSLLQQPGPSSASSSLAVSQLLPPRLVTIKVRFTNGKTSQLSVLDSESVQILFNFCDLELYDEAAQEECDLYTEREIMEECSSKEEDLILTADINSTLARNPPSQDWFSKLPERYDYALQLQTSKRRWLLRPDRTRPLAWVDIMNTSLASVGIKGRVLLVMGKPPQTSENSGTSQAIASSTTAPATKSTDITASTEWEHKFQLLRRFYEQNGHSNVPSSDPNLGMWVLTQRAAYKAVYDRSKGRQVQSRATILPMQIAKLKELKFDWKCSSP